MAQTLRVMDSRLAACDTPDDSDVVKGILAVLFSNGGAKFAAKRMEDKLQAQDMCDVTSLQSLTIAVMLSHFQFTYGEALAVDRQVFPAVMQPPPFSPAPLPAPAPTVAAPAGSRTAPEFPDCGSDGMPSARSLRAWLPGFRAHISGRASADAMCVYDALVADVKFALPAQYSAGVHTDSETVWTALLTAGSKGLPAGIVLSFDPVTVTDRLGLVALKELLSRVFTVSDGSMGVLLSWFQKPDQCTQPWLLGLALTKWSELRQQLCSAGLPQSDIASRLSLLCLCSKLPDLKAVFAALEVAHPSGIPVQTLLATVRSRADSYSSVRVAGTEVSVLAEAYTLVAHHERSGKGKPKGGPKGGYRSKECNLWLQGDCKYGDNCIFKHSGAKGQGKADKHTGAVAEDMGAQLKALQAQVIPSHSNAR
jgi:hypothetical protein